MAREEALFELQCQRAIVVILIFLSRTHVTLAAGECPAVADNAVTATTRIIATSNSDTAVGAIRAVKTPGVGFTVKSSNAADTGEVSWQIIQP